MTITSLDDEARRLFEADPSSSFEAAWPHLPEYKREGWRRVAIVKRERKAAALDLFTDNELIDELTRRVIARGGWAYMASDSGGIVIELSEPPA